jgi:lysophospholipase L1-like esterase
MNHTASNFHAHFQFLTAEFRIMPDGLHPNAHGYDLWYEAMNPLLAEMMK